MQLPKGISLVYQNLLEHLQNAHGKLLKVQPKLEPCGCRIEHTSAVTTKEYVICKGTFHGFFNQ